MLGEQSARQMGGLGRGCPASFFKTFGARLCAGSENNRCARPRRTFATVVSVHGSPGDNSQVAAGTKLRTLIILQCVANPERTLVDSVMLHCSFTNLSEELLASIIREDVARTE